MRHNALFRRFISALTRGGPGGLPRPIEVHAHDPLRYAGDMLGWLHQVWILTLLLWTRWLLGAVMVIISLLLSMWRPWLLKESSCSPCSTQMQWQILDRLLAASPGMQAAMVQNLSLTWYLFWTEYLKEFVGHLKLELNKFCSLNLLL